MYFRDTILEFTDVYLTDKALYESCLEGFKPTVIKEADLKGKVGVVLTRIKDAIIKAMKWLWGKLKDLGRLIARFFKFITSRRKKTAKQIEEIEDAVTHGVPEQKEEPEVTSKEGDTVGAPYGDNSDARAKARARRTVNANMRNAKSSPIALGPAKKINLEDCPIPESLNKYMFPTYSVGYIGNLLESLENNLNDTYNTAYQGFKATNRRHDIAGITDMNVEQLKSALYYAMTIPGTGNGQLRELMDFATRSDNNISNLNDLRERQTEVRSGDTTYGEYRRNNPSRSYMNSFKDVKDYLLKGFDRKIKYMERDIKDCESVCGEVIKKVNEFEKTHATANDTEVVDALRKLNLNCSKINASVPVVLADCIVLNREQYVFYTKYVDNIHRYICSLGYPSEVHAGLDIEDRVKHKDWDGKEYLA